MGKCGYETVQALAVDAAQVGVSYSTVYRISKGENISQGSLSKVCQLLNVDWKALLENKSGSGHIPFCYSSLLEFAKRIDDGKLDYFKSVDMVNTEHFNRWQDSADLWYKDGENERDYRFDSRLIDELFKERIRVNRYEIETLQDVAKSNLNIIAPSTFSPVTFKSESIQLEIDNPEVLWPCNCEQSKTIKAILDQPLLKESLANQLKAADVKPCPLHSDRARNCNNHAINHLFRHCLININVNDIDIVWKQDRHLWPPSVDVNIMLKVLTQHFEKLKESARFKKPKRILDVGAGTGILGIWLAKYFPTVDHICYTDWLFHSSMFSYMNHLLNFGSLNQPNANFRLSNLMDGVQDDRFDISICNPPYLPNPANDPKLYRQSTVTGIDLLKDYILKAPDICPYNFVIFSNITHDAIAGWAESNNRKVEPVCGWIDIPFRVNHFLNSLQNVVYLLNIGKLEFNPDKPIPIRHKVAVFSVSKLEQS